MKRIILIILAVLVVGAGFFGYMAYQRIDRVVDQIKLGDAYYEDGEYQEAIVQYQRANAIQPTSQADDRIERARRMLDRQGPPPDQPDTSAGSDTTAVAGGDTTEVIEVEPSGGRDAGENDGSAQAPPPEVRDGPAVQVNIPERTDETTLQALIRTHKFLRGTGTMAVMLENPDGVTEPIAAQIFDNLFGEYRDRLNDIRGNWPESRIILHTSLDDYQTNSSNYAESKAYLDVQSERLKFVWTASNTYFYLYLDQLERYSLFSMYHTRQAIIDTAPAYYDQLKQQAEQQFADEAEATTWLTESFRNYVKQISDQLELRQEQVEQAIWQARPDIAQN